jgi:hypothetical protein
MREPADAPYARPRDYPSRARIGGSGIASLTLIFLIVKRGHLLGEHHDRAGGQLGELLGEVLAVTAPDPRSALGDLLPRSRPSQGVQRAPRRGRDASTPRVGQRSIKLAHDAPDDRPHFERLGSRLRGRADQVRHPLLDARIARHAPLVVRAKHSVGQRVDATDGVAQVFELVLERPLRAPLCLRAAGPDIVRNSDLSGRNRTSVLRPTGVARFERR